MEGTVARSLRVRLTLLYSALFATLFVLFGALLYGVLAHSLNARLDERLASEADTAAGIFADEYREMGGNIGFAAREVVSDMKLKGDIIAVAEGDRILASTVAIKLSQLTSKDRRRAERTVPIEGVPYRVFAAAPLDSVVAELA